MVILGFPTLGVLLWQAIATGKAAAAARDSVKAIMKAERAWVIADLVPMARCVDELGWCHWWGGAEQHKMSEWNRLTAEEVLRGEHLRHGLRFINMGRTAARITGYEIHSGFYDHKKDAFRIEAIRYNRDYNRMLSAENQTETLPGVVIEIHEFVNNAAAEVGPPTWKNWMVVLVSVTYEHVFSVNGPESDVFRFVFDNKSESMQRGAATQKDKEQIRTQKIWPKTERPN